MRRTLTLDYCGVCGGDNVANECEEPVCGDDEFDCLGDGTEVFLQANVIFIGRIAQMEQMKLTVVETILHLVIV